MEFQNCHNCLKYSRWRSTISAKGKNRRPEESESLAPTPATDARASSNCFIASCPARMRSSRYACESVDDGASIMAALQQAFYALYDADTPTGVDRLYRMARRNCQGN